MRRVIVAGALALALLVGGSAAAGADPAFGPGAGQGEGNNDPHETPGTRCHPPGQTDDQAECK